MEIILKIKRLELLTSLYVVPTFSHKGPFVAWRQTHAQYKRGFIARFLWFGWVLRQGRLYTHNNNSIKGYDPH